MVNIQLNFNYFSSHYKTTIVCTAVDSDLKSWWMTGHLNRVGQLSCCMEYSNNAKTCQKKKLALEQTLGQKYH